MVNENSKMRKVLDARAEIERALLAGLITQDQFDAAEIKLKAKATKAIDKEIDDIEPVA